ncbi:MAG: hypothetical protein MUF43_01645 [Flavobacterium sp.]|jgi:hypothetical protein|nr:hypothetical protein [Flavobacterium sp.]
MKHLIIYFSFLVPILSSAQISNYDISNNMMNSFGREVNSSKDNAEGSKYISDKFEPAIVKGFNDQAIIARYNAFDDEIEFQSSGKIYKLLKDDGLTVMFNNGKVYFYTNFKAQNEESYGFLIRHKEFSNFSIYGKESVKFTAAKEANSSYGVSKPASYDVQKEEFLIEVAGKIVAVPKKKKDFLSLFGEKATAVESYMKANKVSNSSKEDLIKIATFLNEN